MRTRTALFIGLGLLMAAPVQAAPSAPGVKKTVRGDSSTLIRLETEAGGLFGGEPGVMDLACDDDGTAWLTLPRGGPALGIFRQGRWSTTKLSEFPDSLRGQKLVRLADGSVACLWKDVAQADEWVLSYHRFRKHAIGCRLSLKLQMPRLLPLADGGLLITEKGRHVVRIHPNDRVQRLELPQSLFIEPGKNEDGSVPADHVAVHAVQDQSGEVWLWSYAMQPREHQWRLRGLLRLDGESFRAEKLGEMDSSVPLSAVAAWEEGTLAVAVSGKGLFALDPVRQSFQPVQPQAEELQHVEKIFRAHGDWHFITTPRPTEQLDGQPHRFYDPEKRGTALFRLHEDKLEVLTWKLDAEPEFGWVDRPVLEGGRGFWTCSREAGLLYLMWEKEAPVVRRPLDWRSGAMLQGPCLLAKAAVNGLLVVGDPPSSSALALALNTPPPPSPPGPARLEVVEPLSGLVEDGKGGICGMLRDGALHRWKAGHWEKMPPPEHVDVMRGSDFVKDEAGQGWLFQDEGGMAAVCDLKSGRWEEFESLEKALQARLKPGSRLRPCVSGFPEPVAAPADLPRRIAFLQFEQEGSADVEKLHYFDGTRWQAWKVGDIAGPDRSVTADLKFDSAGVLALPIQDVWWKLGSSGQWRRTEGDLEGVSPSPRYRQPVVPEGCPVERVRTSAYDRLGVCWLTDEDGKLWKCLRGVAVPALHPGEDPGLGRHPSVGQVLLDDASNAFVLMPFSSYPVYLLVRPRLPPPEAKILLRGVDGDVARLALGQAAWHAWRLDGGAWSKATDQKEAVLTGLAPGTHELEVVAYNADLTPAPKPATFKLDIRAADQSDVDKAVLVFASDDLDACEAAARRLRIQGKDMLPRLRKARETTGERAQWWLEAVIQHIETH